MLHRLIRIPEQHPGRVIVGLGLVLAVAYTAALLTMPRREGRIVVGDAVYYYVYLRSAVFDHDLQFQNEYIRLWDLTGGETDSEWVYEPTATGHVRNVMSVGPAILWLPLFLLVTAGVAAADLVGVAYPLDGYGGLFQASAGYSGIGLAVFGAWMAYLLSARLFGPRAAIWASLTMWLGSHAIYYSVISPTYSHAASMAVASLFFYGWATSLDRQTPGRYARVGALAGLVALVRWQDAVFLVVPFIDALWHARRPDGRSDVAWTPLLVNLVACGAAALLVFSPQVAVWVVLYGRPFVVPQGDAFMRWFSPNLIAVLFSDWHGLLTWTPVVGLSLLGFLPLFRRAPLVAVAMGVAFVIGLYATAVVSDWWAGEAYGARRLLGCYPIFVVGAAALFDRYLRSPGRLATVAIVFIGLNGLLLLQYQLFMHGLRTMAPYPQWFWGLVGARFVVPFKLMGWLLGW